MTDSHTRQVVLLRGDGIGPEVVDATVRVLEAMRLPLELGSAEIGFGAYQRLGTPLPDATLDPPSPFHRHGRR